MAKVAKQPLSLSTAGEIVQNKRLKQENFVIPQLRSSSDLAAMGRIKVDTDHFPPHQQLCDAIAIQDAVHNMKNTHEGQRIHFVRFEGNDPTVVWGTLHKPVPGSEEEIRTTVEDRIDHLTIVIPKYVHVTDEQTGIKYKIPPSMISYLPPKACGCLYCAPRRPHDPENMLLINR
jgi:hypothetical protein